MKALPEPLRLQLIDYLASSGTGHTNRLDLLKDLRTLPDVTGEARPVAVVDVKRVDGADEISFGFGSFGPPPYGTHNLYLHQPTQSAQIPAGYALAMRVLQSDMYPKLDDVERAECDAFIAAGLGRSAPQPPQADVARDAEVNQLAALLKTSRAVSARLANDAERYEFLRNRYARVILGAAFFFHATDSGEDALDKIIDDQLNAEDDAAVAAQGGE